MYSTFYSIRFQLFSILGTNVKHTLNGPNEAKHLISKRRRSLEAIVIESDNEKLYGSLELKERSLLLNGVRLKSSPRRLKSNDNYNTGIAFLDWKYYQTQQIVRAYFHNVIIKFMFNDIGGAVKSKDKFEDHTNSHSKEQWPKTEDNESNMFVGTNE